MPGFEERGLRPTWLQIDLSALEENFRAIREKAGPGREICAVVKANSYGLGAVPIAERLQALGCDCFGVAMLEEGRELREAGISRPIMLLGHLYGEESIRRAAGLEIEICIHNFEILAAVARAARGLGRPLRTHLKVDTGMGRLGVLPKSIPAWCEEARRAGVELSGVFTTFSSSEDPNSPLAAEQLERFAGAIDSLRRCGFDPPLKHAANSGAILNFPDSLLTMIRPGLLLYGLAPAPGPLDHSFRAVASLHSRVVQLSTYPAGSRIGYSGTFTTKRESRIAVLPIGYADGLNRLLSNNAEVLISGRRVPVVGRVSMDLITVDVTDVPSVGIGDLATIFGRDGDEEIGVWEIARRTGSIPWEVLCWIGDRVPRVHSLGGEILSIRSRLVRAE